MIRIIDCNVNEFIQRNREKKVYCYGIGKQFECFVRKIHDIEICGLIDGDVSKQNTVKRVGNRQLKISSIETYVKKYTRDKIIVITTAFANQVVEVLDSYKELTDMDCYVYMLMESFMESVSSPVEYPKQKRIPKKIHYCWFGSKTLPGEFEKNIDSWKKFCPDYEIVRWDESNIDIEDNLYMKQAYERKVWAFVSDVARIKIIHDEGGIYLDTDVELIKNLDDLLGWNFFCGYENRRQVAFGLGYGAIKKHPILKSLLDLYSRISFVDKYGNINRITCPHYQTQALRDYGFRLNGKFEQKDGIAVFPREFFAPYNDMGLGKITERTYSIHWFSASWLNADENRKREEMKNEIQKVYRRIELQRISKK